jgi:molybdate transport system ATP-binding protein
MALEVDIRKTLSDFDLDISFTCKKGELNVFVGPSGAGKTTLIRIIAGLESPDKGFIAYDGEIWVDTKQGIFLPPQKRRLGYVFQEYTLFPHLSVYGNVGFAAPDEKEIESLLKIFGIWHLKDSMPDKISGGERQRCAICQNLARQPRVMLLDEPFSALDFPIRKKLRQELKALKKDLSFPIVYVTHDLTEALFLGDHVLPIVFRKPAPAWLQDQMENLMEDYAWMDVFLKPQPTH